MPIYRIRDISSCDKTFNGIARPRKIRSREKIPLESRVRTLGECASWSYHKYVYETRIERYVLPTALYRAHTGWEPYLGVHTSVMNGHRYRLFLNAIPRTIDETYGRKYLLQKQQNRE